MSELIPINPIDRVYYSNNPQNTVGAHEQPDIEAILQPEIAAGFEVLDDARLQGPKYTTREVAQQQLAQLDLIDRFLDPERSQDTARRIGMIRSYLEPRVQKDTTRETKKADAAMLNEHLKDMTDGVAIVTTRFMMDMSTKEARANNLKGLERTISEAYAKDPTMVFDMWDRLVEMHQQPELDEVRRKDMAEAEKEFVNILAKQPFPLRSGDDIKDILLFEKLDFKKMFGDDKPLTPKDGTISKVDNKLFAVPDEVSVWQIGSNENKSPYKPIALAVWSQFIRYAQAGKNPEDTLQRFNAVYERALDHGKSYGASNLLVLPALTFSGQHESIADLFNLSGVDEPPKISDVRGYYEPLSLLARGHLRNFFGKPSIFTEANTINAAILGTTGLDFGAVGKILEKVDSRYGTDIADKLKLHEAFPIDQIRDTPRDSQVFIDSVHRNAVYRHRAAELRYELGVDSGMKDMLITPQVADVLEQLRDKVLTNPTDIVRKHYQDPRSKDTLSHPGYFTTVAKMLGIESDAAGYEELRNQIEEMKVEIQIDGHHFISPSGDKFLVDDKNFRKAGLRDITFSKIPRDRRYLRTDVRFENTDITCVITPDMDLQTIDGKPLILPKDMTEPLEYLIFGYLRALKCQPETTTEVSGGGNKDSEPAETVVRRAHMRRLPDGQNPKQKQIDLAFEDDDFDVVIDNIARARQGLQIRTYVGQTEFNADNTKPNIFRAQQVTNNLKTTLG